jgi:hypothetical protein
MYWFDVFIETRQRKLQSSVHYWLTVSPEFMQSYWSHHGFANIELAGGSLAFARSVLFMLLWPSWMIAIRVFSYLSPVGKSKTRFGIADLTESILSKRTQRILSVMNKSLKASGHKASRTESSENQPGDKLC